jgi:hypothetical protein
MREHLRSAVLRLNKTEALVIVPAFQQPLLFHCLPTPTAGSRKQKAESRKQKAESRKQKAEF